MTAPTPPAGTSGDPVADAQADVARIREDLAETVNALVAKTDVAARAKDAGSRLTAQVGDSTGRLKDATTSLAADGQERVHAAGEQVQDRFASVRADVGSGGLSDRLRSPEVIAALGLATAALAAGLIALLRRRR